MARPATAKSRKLTAEVLIALGPERLAQLILGQAETDPLFARAARMALAAKDDVASLAHEIDKRLKTIRRSRGLIDWEKVRPLARELDQLRQSIFGPLAEQSPPLAIEQMRLFLSLAEPVFERAGDSNGALGEIFRQAGEDLGTLWVRAGPRDPATLAADILSLIEADGYGVFDSLPDAASPALGSEGRAAMRRLLTERQIALSGDERRRYDYRVNWLLPRLADLDDDVDAFIATVDATRRNAIHNAQVAERLIAQGRAEEALQWIDTPTDRGHQDRALADLRLAALMTLGRAEQAQTQRRHIFERWLDAEMLRGWLKALPAFEEFEAERDALDLVAGHADAGLALDFLIRWPDLKRAAALVAQRLDACGWTPLRSRAARRRSARRKPYFCRNIAISAHGHRGSRSGELEILSVCRAGLSGRRRSGRRGRRRGVAARRLGRGIAPPAWPQGRFLEPCGRRAVGSMIDAHGTERPAC